MPYGDNVPTLDFTGIHVASICGDNGSGKSAIIDAITWALWGETRARRDDDLIHQGQTEVEVDFEFAVGQQRYRVVRGHSKPRRQRASGQTRLHLQIATGDGLRAIDGDTISQTQQKIIDILHMDYDTFTNSAYLRQGHADEFTTASPSRRKEVLGNILGLSLYDKLEDRARDLARQREMAKEQLDSSIGEITAELAQMPLYQAELHQAQSVIITFEESIKGVETALGSLRQQKELMETKRAQLAELERNIGERGRQLLQWQEQSGQLQVRIKEHEELLVRRAEIEAGYARFIEARNQDEALNRSLALVNRLNQKKYELERLIEREQQTLVREHALAQSRATELKKTSQELPRLWDESKQIKHQQESIAQQEAVLDKNKQTSQEWLTQIKSIEADTTRLEREIQEIAGKLHLLKSEPGARCPLCGCELGEDGLKHIEIEYDAQRHNKTGLVKANQSAAKLKQADLKSLTEEIGLTERSLAQEKAQLQGRLGACEREISRAEEAGKQLKEEEARRQEIEERLGTKNFAVPQQEQLRQLELELASLGYDSSRHEKVQQLYESLLTWEAPKRRLDEADSLITREKESLAGIEKMADQLREALQGDEKKKLELIPAVGLLPKVSTELAQKELELKDLGQQHSQAQERLGGIKGRLEHLTQLEVRKKEREGQRDLYATEGQVYHDLAEAFGKKGVQVFIIETALPEIENEANRLLAKMTDGRMSVKIETQRETQKGDTLETLDIKISDELGIRNYEMYSGGEAFRINFSIRIALSRLLARRAGAPLPTLIIDEGFGTQDAAGIEKLKEAITSIQDDFEKILVITHIEDLREAFPARIDVVKTSAGSMLSLN